MALALSLVGCGDDEPETATSPSTSEGSTATDPSDQLVAFAAEADLVCSGMTERFKGLTDPDGEGGQKPIGLGRVVSEVFAELGAVRPPADHSATWDQAIGLLIDSGRRLTESEELAAAGNEAASEAAQSEALFELQPKAHELITEIGAPFKVCFVA